MEEALQRKKILIVDDEQDLREALFTVLAAEGYEVLSEDNGEAGLSTALKEQPDLILLDVKMPKMDGYQVLAALQEDEWGKRAKVLVLTAFHDMDSVSKILEAGGTDYLVKSDVDLKAVTTKVAEVLAR